ncbi:MAG: lipopolysaccharide assembly protein LapA domain-containing protein [Aquificaceae bacterium]|nr:lipopolysaccharide assembly protein LapA domain-containing protein [Aquificaceae bacterium]MDW8423331.1 lipopolysaccharide assembly protein LapA domain-containing protein [Aquificaceae bacterium]
MSLLKVLVALSLLVLFLLFIAQNASYVDVSFFYTTYRLPLFVLLLLTFAFGFLFPSFYFLLREASLKRRLNNIEEGFKEWSRGYLNRAEKLLLYPSRHYVGLRSFLAQILWKQGKKEEALSMDSYTLALLGEMLLKDGREEAEEKLKETLAKDEENLRALKGLRNLYALRKDWELALEYQDRILQLCEKWEKEKQKRIKAEIMAEVYLKGGGEKFIDKAMDLQTTPFVYSVYLKHLLSQNRTKDVRKVWEKLFSLGYQEEVLWMLLEDQEVLTKLLDLIEAKTDFLSADTLAMIYIKLNLFSKAKELEDKLSNNIKALLYSTLSHREQDRYCMESIGELLKPFVCSCGKAYNRYLPVCAGCFEWGDVKLRRG